MKTAPLVLYTLGLWSSAVARSKEQGQNALPADEVHCAVASVDDAVARTAAAAAWIRGGPPPRHWTVSREADAPVGAPLEQGAIKRAFAVPHRSDLLIKTVKPRRHGRRPARTEAHTLAEILYLEFLRGRRGVPALHGGWMANGTVFYVVQHVGAALANRTSEGFFHPSAPWLERCRSRPLDAAVALLACVRSFADAGYADLDHSLDGRQLTLADDGDVYLIDAPEPLPTSPVSDVVEWALRGTYQPRPTGAGKCAMDTDCPGAIHDADRGRCAKRDCTPGFEQGANETKGWCRAARCAPVTARTLAFDLATRTWALPLILAEGRFPSAGTKRAFGDLIDTMRRAAPEDRPSFAEALSVVSAVEEPGPPEPVSLTDAAVARAAAAAAWFRGAPPPRHWTLTASLARDLNQTLGAGACKKALAVTNRAELLVKTRADTVHPKRVQDDRGELAVRAEVLYLEVARGRRGVPALYGGWIDKDRVYYVVQRAGKPITTQPSRHGKGTHPPRGQGQAFLAPSARQTSTCVSKPLRQPMNRQMRHQSLPSQPWLQRCRDAPVEAARALLECFRSFTDSGYLMGDLHGAQFTLNDAGEVFAIDAPEPRPGAPVAATLDWALEGAAQKARGLGGLGMNCSRDGSTGGRGDCPMTSDVERCALGDCIRGFEAGARETRGWCRRSWCVGVDARAHVFDLATRTWALPLILQEGRFPSPAAKRRLEELAKRMRSEAPEDRPSLADALVALDAAPAS